MNRRLSPVTRADRINDVVAGRYIGRAKVAVIAGSRSGHRQPEVDAPVHKVDGDKSDYHVIYGHAPESGQPGQA